MEKLIVKGGNALAGTVKVSGAKNAVLPIIAASILGTTPSRLDEIPALEDVRTICEVLKCLGLKIDASTPGILNIDSREITSCEAPYELVRSMRASFLVMGSLLARKGRARISQPGGCAIGTRPIDIHLKGFEALGVKIETGHGYIEASAPNGLVGTTIYLDFPSVGATENLMMAASMAQGVTTIENAAQEPEIVDLANYLNVMGAKVRGAGTNVVTITGVEKLHGAEHTVIPDRIEAGTYMVAAAMTGGNVRVENVLSEHLKPLIAKLKEAGAEIKEDVGGVQVIGPTKLKPITIKTLPYPGFPTDMQAQVMALMTIANGQSLVTETVFENRFMHVEELIRMGADIHTEGRSATVKGVKKLMGCQVKATDLRAGAAMILAGLVAEGTTEISDIYHIDRGYENITEKLCTLGAEISRCDI
ncbi:MAG TPA: UDP-N-acetylglucosamine 1-carboxyvinyltransferase [Candidatus Avacidaminococcus intestinavium]|uniref:UDP-N-acetylglucosamine 1-carboxyvinyltransferase n=1 Tax=Candidatus Avacidaminococcus intestinavium TaxID=2840684 RepID=A0A9D1SLS0_9FIRM|nr:UDP-N-acetylglucosamine 1-carboxyvinyltransferase [Candidatus Avacidaminococcus intestinavium]